MKHDYFLVYTVHFTTLALAMTQPRTMAQKPALESRYLRVNAGNKEVRILAWPVWFAW